jgi:hypothetical protein
LTGGKGDLLRWPPEPLPEYGRWRLFIDHGLRYRQDFDRIVHSTYDGNWGANTMRWSAAFSSVSEDLAALVMSRLEATRLHEMGKSPITTEERDLTVRSQRYD